MSGETVQTIGTNSQRSQSRWVAIAAVVVILGPPVGWVLLAQSFAKGPQSPLFLLLSVATWLGCAALVVLAIKWAGIRAMLGVLVVGVLVVGCQAAWLPGFFTRMRCGAWDFIVDGTVVRVYIGSLQENVNLPAFAPNAARWFARHPEHDRVFDDYCSGYRLRDVRVGRYTLADLRAGRVTLDEFERETASAFEGQQWERLGRLTFSRSTAAYRTKSSDVIVAFRQWDYGGRPPLSLGFADGRVETVRLSDIEQAEFAKWFAALEQLGITPPDELVKFSQGILIRAPNYM